MGILNIVKDLFKPAAELVDNLHTSTEEKLNIKATMLTVQAAFLEKALDYETKALEARAGIIEAEAKSDSWLTANWRPVTMVTFLALVVAYWFGYTPEGLSEARVEDIFGLIKLGLGGYVVGRSVEKVVPSAVKALKSREEV